MMMYDESTSALIEALLLSDGSKIITINGKKAYKKEEKDGTQTVRMIMTLEKKDDTD